MINPLLATNNKSGLTHRHSKKHNALFLQHLLQAQSQLLFAANATGQLHVLGHDGDALGVDRAEVSILKERNEVRLRGLLQRQQSMALQPHIIFNFTHHLAHKALERQLADEQLRRLLIPTDLAKGDRARAEAVRLVAPIR